MAVDLDWKRVVEPIMKLYTEATDGSSIEIKESALVWHHKDADRDFGSWQAKELLDHLEHVIANEPAVVRRGKDIVEVKPQVCISLLSLPHPLASMHYITYLISNPQYAGCKQRFGYRESYLNHGW